MSRNGALINTFFKSQVSFRSQWLNKMLAFVNIRHEALLVKKILTSPLFAQFDLFVR